MERLKKILFIIPNMGGGGAERMMSHLLKGINRCEYDTALILYEKKGVFLEGLPKNLRIYDFEINAYQGHFIQKIPKLVKKTTEIIKSENPDVLVTFTPYANIIAAIANLLLKKPVKHIMSEQTMLSAAYRYYSKMHFLLTRITGILYRKADNITAASPGIKNDLMNNFSVDEKRIKIIYNCVDLEQIKKLTEEEIDDEWFDKKVLTVISVGRLEKQKNHRFLIKVFFEVTKKINCKLLILGEGPERKGLEKLVEKLRLGNRVVMPGFKTNPFKYMNKSSVFVLSSVHEGFALVLVEAIACGIPVISTDCESGPSDIIKNDYNGFLVPVNNEIALKNAMKTLLTNSEKRTYFIENSEETPKKFSREKYIKKFEEIIRKLIEK